MARFYGTVQGGRGEASRLGHATCGLNVRARSWNGEVCVRLYAKGDVDYVRISEGSTGRDIYSGPIAALAGDDRPRALIAQHLLELTDEQRLELFQELSKTVMLTHTEAADASP